ncbi:MAG: CopG family transcriptional regulator [Nitrospirae bacterium]|nr:CopG family transcriptional regulator [Nitrospirota bacterium]
MSKLLSVRIEDYQDKKLNLMVAKYGKSKGSVIKDALRHYFNTCSKTQIPDSEITPNNNLTLKDPFADRLDARKPNPDERRISGII